MTDTSPLTFPVREVNFGRGKFIQTLIRREHLPEGFVAIGTAPRFFDRLDMF